VPTAPSIVAGTELGEGSNASVHPAPARSFFVWGAGGYLAVTGVMVALTLRATGGALIYALDDPAIHLSIAEQLAVHGTWGVEPGIYQSASSSPVWTSLLALIRLVAPFAFTAGPLVINVAAGLWAIAALNADQRLLRPGWLRPLDAVAAVVLTTVVLFLPALTMLGMEHVLHIALSLSIIVLFARQTAGRDLGWPRWTLPALLAMATLVRMETAFLAAGLALACLVPWTAAVPRSLQERVGNALRVGLASGIPLVAFSLFNKAMGQGWLPNSVLAKGQVVNGEAGEDLFTVLGRLTTDPLLIVITVVVALAVIAGWRQRNYVGIGIAYLVAVAGHVAVADVGWFDRYQAYLIAIGVLVLLLAGTEYLANNAGGQERRRLAPALVLVALLACGAKIDLSLHVVDAVRDTWQQRYQTGLFLETYYDGQPIATGELGYISLRHDGPTTDLFGLGDYEVLGARRAMDQKPSKDYWAALAEQRGFRVVAVYPFTLWTDTPDNWILVGTWKLPRPETVTAFQPEFQFWATTPDEVAPLQEHLRAFAERLPAGVVTNFDPFATLRAEQLSS
jgi:hypothetical protein